MLLPVVPCALHSTQAVLLTMAMTRLRVLLSTILMVRKSRCMSFGLMRFFRTTGLTWVQACCTAFAVFRLVAMGSYRNWQTLHQEHYMPMAVSQRILERHMEAS